MQLSLFISKEVDGVLDALTIREKKTNSLVPEMEGQKDLELLASLGYLKPCLKERAEEEEKDS